MQLQFLLINYLNGGEICFGKILSEGDFCSPFCKNIKRVERFHHQLFPRLRTFPFAPLCYEEERERWGNRLGSPNPFALLSLFLLPFTTTTITLCPQEHQHRSRNLSGLILTTIGNMVQESSAADSVPKCKPCGTITIVIGYLYHLELVGDGNLTIECGQWKKLTGQDGKCQRTISIQGLCPFLSAHLHKRRKGVRISPFLNKNNLPNFPQSSVRITGPPLSP